MIKTKYQRMSKEEQKEARKKYYSTPSGKLIKTTLRNGLICSILCFLVGAYLIYDAFFNTHKLLDQIYGIVTFVFGFLFLVSFFKIRVLFVCFIPNYDIGYYCC